MNKEQQGLLDEVYKNYSKEYEKDNSIGMCLLVARMDGKKTYRKPNKEMFVGLCTSDKTFSEKWGLTIEERELNLEERLDLLKKLEIFQERVIDNAKSEMIHSLADSHSIPTKLITISYNNQKIESYE